MKAYHQTDLFKVLMSAARNPNLVADPTLQSAYNRKRFNQAVKSLRTRNIFLYTEGARTSVDLNNTNTIYTQPVGERLLLLGYADNFRYGEVQGATAAGPNPTNRTLVEMHRVRVVGLNERVLIDDYVPAQAGVSGQPRYTECRLTAPTIIEPGEQIAVDLGYDQAATTITPANLPPEAFIFFCLKIKDQLTQQDQEALADVRRYINGVAFQRAIYFNCSALGSDSIGLTSASAALATATCFTPPTGEPVLITGIATSLQASKVMITDTSDGSSFSLNRPMQSSAFNMPDYEGNATLATYGAPVVAPIWNMYFPLPFPHLLVRGAQLRADIVNGGNAGAGVNTVTEQGIINQLLFQGVTV